MRASSAPRSWLPCRRGGAVRQGLRRPGGDRAADGDRGKRAERRGGQRRFVDKYPRDHGREQPRLDDRQPGGHQADPGERADRDAGAAGVAEQARVERPHDYQVPGAEGADGGDAGEDGVDGDGAQGRAADAGGAVTRWRNTQYVHAW